MSTWIMHLRVAEQLKHLLGDIDEAAYYAGSVAPDSGRMVDDFTYIPHKDVSHWKRDDVSYEQRFLDNAEFYYKYCVNEPDLFKKSLFWGYYIHILTDTIYVRDLIHPFIERHGKPFWRENITAIRKGWYEIDFRFLANNKGFKPFELLKNVKPFTNEYLDYFSPTDIYERVLYAVVLYSNSKVNPDCRFVTHTPEAAEKMVADMVSEISSILKKQI